MTRNIRLVCSRVPKGIISPQQRQISTPIIRRCIVSYHYLIDYQYSDCLLNHSTTPTYNFCNKPITQQHQRYDRHKTRQIPYYQLRNYKTASIATVSELNLHLRSNKNSPNEVTQSGSSPSSRFFTTNTKTPPPSPSSSSSTSSPPPSPSKTTDNLQSPSASLIITKLPPSLQPYANLARIDKPIGTMLLLYPCCWSTAIAASPTIISTATSSSYTTILGDPTLLLVFTTGSFLMRGAGCTINDLWDAPYDASVSRTRSRPLPSGQLSTHQAMGFLGLQTLGGLGVLLSLPHLEYCFWLGAASLPLVVSYPLMKRFMNYPQLILGLTFNWGAFMGWAATHGDLTAYNGLHVVLPLYGGGVAWTLVYDTLYAHQDKIDDAKLGLRSTALTFGDTWTKPILGGCVVTAVSCWMLAGYNVGYQSPLFYGGIGLAGGHLVWQVVTADLADGGGLAKRFRSNGVVGALVFGSCVMGNLGEMV